ncbi:hypothetical protein BS78_03G216800 [Paspalum vaginatum]|nr:hypothetical protein BS78_03G216800 [Paspalum vaginatum]
MASDDEAHRDAALARLSGPEIVDHLRTTFRKADYAAAARVLAARDSALADAEAKLLEARAGMAEALAEIEVLREQRLAFKAASRGPARRTSPSGGAIADPAPRADGRAEGADRSKDAGGGGGEEDWEDGEFRPGVAGVSWRKESASEGGQGRREGVSAGKRKSPASACSSDSDEDDTITLSQLMKKLRGAEPVANGGPKKGHGDVQGNSAGPLGVDRTVISSVNRRSPEATANHRLGGSEDSKVAVFVQGKGNGRSGEDGGLHRTMSIPLLPGSAVGIEMHKAHNDTGSSLDGTISMVPKATGEQEKTTGGGHMTKVSLETDGIGEGASIVLSAIKEQGKPNGQVLKANVLPGADVIEGQGDKLGPCHSKEVSGGGKLKTSAKPMSAVLKPKNQLPLLSEQTPVESPLHSVSRHWKSASDVFTSCLQNKELCMQAACALHRQGMLTAKPTEGGRSGCSTRLSKFDAHRFPFGWQP